MNVKHIKNLIIGAGPAGLAVAGRLRKMDIDFAIIEKSNSVGNTWKNHYDRLHLHTVKQLSHLPHLPFPKSAPLYVPRGEVVEYLENYAKEFKIAPIFNQEVETIKKLEGDWLVQTKNGQNYLALNVIIATGVNRIPNEVRWTGQDKFQGDVIHSRFYKNPQPFLGQKVLVVGMGNTGAELALDLCEAGIECSISVRGPINFVPRDVNGRPVQLTAKTLAKIPFGIGDWLGTQIRKRIIGDLSTYGIKHSAIHPTIQLKETGKTPVIDIGTVDKIKEGKIKICPEIKELFEQGAIFKNGQQQAFDTIILATGYKALIEDFVEDGKALLDRFGWPKEVIATNKHSGLYFVGFDNYKLGGILGTIFKDSETVANDLRAKG